VREFSELFHGKTTVSKQFWVFFAIGLIAVAITVGVTMESTKGNHLELDGRILHVRLLALNPKATIVVVDFREKNPSDVRFIVKNIEMTLEGVKDDPSGQIISKYDLQTVFDNLKLVGPKFNEALSTGDLIAPHEQVDRMVGARFELGEQAIAQRTAVRIRIEDLDRTVAELVEKQ
jgi:hypothetical protein